MEHLDYNFHSEFNDRYSLIARKAIGLLSENSRITIPEMAQKVGLSRQAMAIRLGKLEAELGINYTVELNEELLGLTNPHLILVKFGSKPSYAYLKRLLKSSHIPQMVAVIKGGYQLLIYANSVSKREYVHWDKSTQALLAEYNVSWSTSEIAHRQLGFLPLRDETIERLPIEVNFRKIIKVLNSNSRASFQEISRRSGMHFNTVAYNFKKMLARKYIKRFTLTLDKINELTLMSNFGKYRISKNFERDAASARMALISDDEFPIVSRYVLCCQLIGSQDFFSLGAFDSLGVAHKKDILYYKNSMRDDSVEATYGVVEKLLLGRLPTRSLESKKVFDTIKWTP